MDNPDLYEEIKSDVSYYLNRYNHYRYGRKFTHQAAIDEVALETYTNVKHTPVTE